MEITIPENLNDITIKQYANFNADVNKDSSDEFVQRKMIQHFCNIPSDIVREVEMDKFSEAINIINAAFERESKFRQTFTLNGQTYGFIPKLDSISFGEYIDLNKYLQDHTTFNRAMAVMYRPVTMKKNDMYLIEKYESSDKYFDEMDSAPLEIFMGAMVFFYNLVNALMKAIPSYLELQMKTYQSQDSSGKNGDGIKASMRLLKATLEDLTRLQTWGYTSALHG